MRLSLLRRAVIYGYIRFQSVGLPSAPSTPGGRATTTTAVDEAEGKGKNEADEEPSLFQKLKPLLLFFGFVSLMHESVSALLVVPV